MLTLTEFFQKHKKLTEAIANPRIQDLFFCEIIKIVKNGTDLADHEDSFKYKETTLLKAWFTMAKDNN